MKQTSVFAILLLALVSTPVCADWFGDDEQDSKKDLMKADANGDGKVSFEEYMAAQEKQLRKRFERKDINKDGFIDLEEKKIAKEKKEAKMKAKEEKMKEDIRKELSEERKTRKRHFYKYQ